MFDEWGNLCLWQGKITEAASAFDEVYQLSKQSISEYEALALYGQARVAHVRKNESEALRSWRDIPATRAASLAQAASQEKRAMWANTIRRTPWYDCPHSKLN
ncbi:MAG TPA: hypothetical protein VFN35_20930 [Ktedonobacteraceae bacterium]|nr:hypothetical protein [Ktedonobacteraceae bacterium]